MTIKAALLDAPASSNEGAFLRIDTLVDEAALTDRHVPAITSCDLPPFEYVWVADAQNQYGGAFWKKNWVEQALKQIAAQQEAG